MTIAKAIGTSRAYIGQVLDALNRLEHRQGRPLISSIVVLEKNGPTVPSEGYYTLARELKPQYASVSDHDVFAAERDDTWRFKW